MATPRRQGADQHVLTVDSTEWLTSHLVRVNASGESLADFGGNGYTDAYVKLLFVDSELGLEPPYDLAALRASLPADRRPVVRTYTVRRVDRAGLESRAFAPREWRRHLEACVRCRLRFHPV